MRGYTDGVQKTISEKSMNKGLQFDPIEFDGDATDPIALYDAITDELGEVIDLDGVKQLMKDGYFQLDDGGEIELDADDEVGSLWLCNDWYTVIDGLSEGGIYLICDTDKEILGARMGAAGEHIGSVSVWVDTFNNTVTGWGETLPLSDSDCEEINDALNEMY